MSNFKKVILFVSMIAVLVSSLMLPTFADTADYPLTDPYIDGYNGDLYIFNIDNVNLTTFSSASSTSVKSYIRPKQYVYFASVILVTKTDGSVIQFDYIPTSTTPNDAQFSWGGMISAPARTIRGLDIGFYGVSINNKKASASLFVDYVGDIVFIQENLTGSYVTHNVCTISEFDSAQVRIYLNYNDVKNNTGSSYTQIVEYDQYGLNIDYFSYRAAQGYYDNGITEGIQQGYQNGYDEGYVEGFASAGGTFADVVSNPQVGLGVPDIRVQFPVFPSDYLTLGSSALTNNLMKFAHVSAVGDSLYEGNGIDVYGSVSEMRWLGTLNSDPKKNGWVCTLWNEAQTAILGTLHWDSARDWEWYEGASATEIELISPDDILTNIRLDIWVHGDSTAFIDTAVLNDNGFAITYPFMGEVFYEDGYNNGYDNGLEDGFNGADTSQAWMNLKDTIFVIFDAPFYVISQSLNFELFGINIAGAIISIISVALIVFILKIIIVRLF